MSGKYEKLHPRFCFEFCVASKQTQAKLPVWINYWTIQLVNCASKSYREVQTKISWKNIQR